MNAIDIANTLLIRLRNNTVTTFAYRTKNGRVRFAVGTLNNKVLRKVTDNRGDGGHQVVTCTTDCITYWDLQKKGWRRCCVGNILYIA